MADSAAHLCDRVLPRNRYRQWTFSFPRWSRFRLARDPDLLSQVLRAFLFCLFSHLRRRARELGIADPHTGSITAIQRFSSFVSLNVHFHALLPDGVFTLAEDETVRFHPLPPPTTDEVVALTQKIIRRLSKLLALEEKDGSEEAPELFALFQAESVQATLPGIPQKRLRTASKKKNRCALIEGFPCTPTCACTKTIESASNAFAATSCARPWLKTTSLSPRTEASFTSTAGPLLLDKPFFTAHPSSSSAAWPP